MVLLTKHPFYESNSRHLLARFIFEMIHVVTRKEDIMTSNQISYWKLLEEQRANALRSEELAEAARANMAREAETKRHNIASERVAAQQVTLGYAQLAESTRANKAGEQLTLGKNIEVERHNIASEGLSAYANETQRTSVTNTGAYYSANVTEQTRHNKQAEELGRSQLNVEKARVNAQNFQSYTQGARNIIGSIGDVLELPSRVLGVKNSNLFGRQLTIWD